MSSVKEAIEEIIEESYLLGLSEEEIRRDFSRFIDTCYSVIHAHVKDRQIISGLMDDLAREKSCMLIASSASGSGSEADPEMQDEEPVRSAHELFAEKVARRKRMILKSIGDYDPHLVRLIEERRFQVDFRKVERSRSRARKHRNWEHHRLVLLKLGYAATVVVIIVLIYLSFIQKS